MVVVEACFVCNQKMNFPGLTTHFEKYHPDEKRVCVRCNKMKNCFKARLFRTDYCIACEKKLECNRCKNFYKTSYLQKHKESCDGKDRAVRTCKQCGQIKNRELFYDTKYTCIECLSITEQCDICHKEILKRNIKRHKLTHTDHPESKEINPERLCNKCNDRKTLEHFSIGKYTCKECLKQRIRCQQCDTIYSFRYEKEHKLRYHTG